jgi:Uma2 family endonuclease
VWPEAGPLPEDALRPGTRLTFEEYARTPESSHRTELYFGVVRDGASTAPHQRVVVQLVVAFELFNRAHLHGFVGVAPSDVVLDRVRALVLQPDVFVVGPERLGIVGRDGEGPPDLVVEVISPRAVRYDRVHKREVYREYGVREYWLVDPAAKTVEVLTWNEGREESRAGFGPGDVAQSRLWLALSVAVDAVLRCG